MKKPLLLAVLAVFCATGALAAPKQRPLTTAPVTTEMDWVFSAEGMAMWRGGFTRNGLVLDADLDKRFDSSIVEPDNAAAGMRAYLERNLGGGRSVELGGFFTTPATRSALLINANENLYAAYGNVYNPANPSFSNSQSAYGAGFTYSTQVMSVEANYKMPFYAFGPNVKIFGGVRWVRVKDKFSSIYYDELNDFQGTDSDIDITNINITNDLFGAQIGLQGMAPLGRGFSIGGRGSFGLYANVQDRKFSFVSLNANNPFGVGSVSVNSTTTEFAQVVELLPRIEYAVARNWTAFVSGQYLLINGVGDATSGYGNIGLVPGGSFTTTNTAQFYGVSGGLKASFKPVIVLLDDKMPRILPGYLFASSG